MEITNENFFNVSYNTELDRLELRKKKQDKRDNSQAQGCEHSFYNSYNVFLFKFFPDL